MWLYKQVNPVITDVKGQQRTAKIKYTNFEDFQVSSNIERNFVAVSYQKPAIFTISMVFICRNNNF
jgi:hypothetical protein